MTLGGRRFLLSLAIVAASVCLALGVSLPIIKLTKFVFFTYEHSLISTVNVLIRSGQMFLGITVLIFSIVLPVVKLLYLLLLSTLPQRELRRLSRQLRALEWLGKWSMHDVLVLSLSIFFIKSQGVYDAKSLQRRLLLHRRRAAHDPGVRVAAERRDRRGSAAAAVGPRTASRRSRRRRCAISLSASSSSWRPSSLRSASCCRRSASPPSTCGPTSTRSPPSSGRSTKNEEFFLCFVIFMFSIFFPFMKLFYLLTLVTSPDMPAEFRDNSISAMEWLGRYSMTDVMVLALMIFYVNASGYTEASVLPGVYFFAASAIMTMFAYGWANSVTPGLADARKPLSLQARLAKLAPPTGEPRQRAS